MGCTSSKSQNKNVHKGPKSCNQDAIQTNSSQIQEMEISQNNNNNDNNGIDLQLSQIKRTNSVFTQKEKAQQVISQQDLYVDYIQQFNNQNTEIEEEFCPSIRW